MLILFFIVFYTLSSSLIFLHGIGLERLLITARSLNVRSMRIVMLFTLKDGALMLCASSISWLLDCYVFAPLGITAITPFFALITVYLCDAGLQRLLFKEMRRWLSRERLFSGGVVIFALYQSFTYIELLTIVVSALISMLLWTFALFAIKLRIEQSTCPTRWKNTPLLLISMGIIALALYAWNGTRIIPALP